MMKFIFYLFFLTLLLSNFCLFMYSLILFSFLFIYLNVGLPYSCMISGLFCMDLLSYSLISLTCWIVFLMVLSSYLVYMKGYHVIEFLLIVLILFISLFLAFSFYNLLLFYISFEFVLIPTLFLLFGWGYQPERLIAGYYLLFYTLFASLPLLLSLFYISNSCFTLSYFLVNIELNFYLFMSLIIAFMVKMPMLFFHSWLPKAHVESPISGSMILAGVLLKLGGYGLYRVFTFSSYYIPFGNYLFVAIGLFSTFVIGLLCLYQTDMKSLIAYSSVSHMGLVIIGIMVYNIYGYFGSFILMIGHAFCSSGLFCLSYIVYERTHSRSLFINKGLMVFIPNLSMFFFIFCIFNMAAPPTLNFLGEIFIINGLISWDYLIYLFMMLSSFFSCCYSIYLYSVINHGHYYSGLMLFSSVTIREYLLLILHFVPLAILFMSFELFSLFI
uniref:NADH-ubiquinone oxidoreductase chain 4 n=1 Tax=Brachyplatys subaeneus TaxID=355284 RepID=A0A2P1CMD6_9HEMI|nr:NADH dehydrogenase subunit 4 [Brachyplatys subaeneus]